MPDLARTRTMSNPRVSGFHSIPGIVPEATTSYEPFKRKTLDTVGFPTRLNHFTSETWEMDVPLADVTIPWFGSYVKDWNKCPPDCAVNGILTTGLNFSAFPPYPKYRRSTSEAIASTHPGEPAISVPNFFYEMKDLPRQYKAWARRLRKEYKTIPEELSNDYLEYQFAIAPLISDLNAMHQVGEWMNRRAKFLTNAREKGFVRRKAELGVFSREYGGSTSYPVCGKNLTNYTGNESVSVSAKSWITARWQHTGNLPFNSFLDDRRHQLLVAALGLDVSFETFWDAMPWTWLVDYFSDLSSIIKTYSNRAGFTFAGACVMETQVWKRTVVPYTNPVWTKPMYGTYTSKTRRSESPSLADASINVLNARQLGNLAALNVSRR